MSKIHGEVKSYNFERSESKLFFRENNMVKSMQYSLYQMQSSQDKEIEN